MRMRAFPLRWLFRLLALALLLAWAVSALWQSQRRLPPGLHIVGPWQSSPAQEVRFLRDLTAADATGAPLVEQQIDDELLRMIGQAREFLVLDTGLFGDLPAAGPEAPRLRTARPLAAILADALLAAKRARPDLQVLLLFDPTSVQLAIGPTPLDRLRAGGIAVVPFAVGRLRSPNPVFAGGWRLCCRWWSKASAQGDLPNPLGVGPPGISIGLWGRLQSFQRSHRQLLIGDDGAGALAGLIVSRAMNAEAGIHSATALYLGGRALEPMLESELVLAQFSGWSGGGSMQERGQRLAERQRALITPVADDMARARVVSEAGIAEALIAALEAAGRGSSIDIAALYLSQRELVRAILDAARRGAAIRILLDPGRDCYGYECSGLPNREVASELVASSDGAVRVRWYRTHGEQFSPSVVLIRDATRSWLLVGTAELSRRDLDDFNLAAAFIAELPAPAAASVDALSWFDTLWYNRAEGGTEYSSDVDVYADASMLHYWEYRLLEASGASFD